MGYSPILSDSAWAEIGDTSPKALAVGKQPEGDISLAGSVRGCTHPWNQLQGSILAGGSPCSCQKVALYRWRNRASYHFDQIDNYTY